jgi:regulator of replication initiation timing
VDRETVINQFDELEKRLESLIETGKRLEAENAMLLQENKDLTAQLQEKVDAERQHDALKDLVKSKIDSLMGRLDEISEE